MGGTLGPLVQGPSFPIARRIQLSANFAVAFTLGALLTFAVAALPSHWWVRPLIAAPVRAALAAAALVLWLALELVALRSRASRFPLCLRRQTPQRYLFKHGAIRTAALWGFDLGTAVSTFRMTGATWAALTLVLLGWSPAWIGLGYAAGFTVPLLTLMWTGRLPPRDPARHMASLDAMRAWRRPAQWTTVALLASGVLLFTVTLFR